MSTGTYISGAGHVGLIGFMILGWGFSADPLPFEVTEVSVVTAEEFDALSGVAQPTVPSDEPPAPEAPDVEEVVEPPAVEEPPATPDAPEPFEPPVEDTQPVAPEIETPPTEVTDAPPAEPQTPQVETVTNTVIGTSPRPRPRPAPRVAPEAVVQPEPDAVIADTTQDSVQDDASAETAVTEEAQQATTQEEATTETVTEADQEAAGEEIVLAPTSSPRPPVRPSRPEPTETAAAPSTETTDAINDLLGDLATDEPAASTPTGPPLSGAEKDGFRIAVNNCWNVDAGSRAAEVTVTVGFSLDQNGRVSGDVRMIGASGGDAGAQRTAYEAARRAVLRCQSSGYDLPAEKYEQWKDVEITFDPSGMRLR